MLSRQKSLSPRIHRAQCFLDEPEVKWNKATACWGSLLLASQRDNNIYRCLACNVPVPCPSRHWSHLRSLDSLEASFGHNRLLTTNCLSDLCLSLVQTALAKYFCFTFAGFSQGVYACKSEGNVLRPRRLNREDERNSRSSPRRRPPQNIVPPDVHSTLLFFLTFMSWGTTGGQQTEEKDKYTVKHHYGSL